MSKRIMRTYTEEFKQEAIRLALQSPSVDAVAKNLGIPGATLHGWLRTGKNGGAVAIKMENGEQTVNVAELLEENRRLHKKLQQTEEEREILKKAAAYFAVHQK
jgi:transposase